MNQTACRGAVSSTNQTTGHHIEYENSFTVQCQRADRADGKFVSRVGSPCVGGFRRAVIGNRHPEKHPSHKPRHATIEHCCLHCVSSLIESLPRCHSVGASHTGLHPKEI